MILARLLNKVDIVTATFSGANECSLHVAHCRRHGKEVNCTEPKEFTMESRKRPVVIAVRGYGVITKKTTSAVEITERITAPDSGFVWTRSGDSITFVKAGQLNMLGESLAGVRIVEMRCTDEPEKAIAEYYFSEYVNLRTLLKPSAAGSVLARTMAAKLKLPVLGMLLLTLVVNTLATPELRTRHDNAAMELEALRRTIGQADEEEQHRRELMAEYTGMTLPVAVSFLCDRVAMVMPDGIVLTELAVQPPLNALDENHKLELAENRIDIEGNATEAADVARYVTDLSELAIASEVRLAQMEQDREYGSFAFRIELEL